MQRLPEETVEEFQNRRLREDVAQRIEGCETFDELRQTLAHMFRHREVPVRVAPIWERARRG